MNANALMTSKQLIAWSRPRGKRTQATTHLVAHSEATRTLCGRTIYPETWSMAKRVAGEPSCPQCVAILERRQPAGQAGAGGTP